MIAAPGNIEIAGAIVGGNGSGGRLSEQALWTLLVASPYNAATGKASKISDAVKIERMCHQRIERLGDNGEDKELFFFGWIWAEGVETGFEEISSFETADAFVVS